MGWEGAGGRGEGVVCVCRLEECRPGIIGNTEIFELLLEIAQGLVVSYLLLVLSECYPTQS